MNKKFLIVIIVIAVFVVGIGAFFILKKDDSKEEQIKTVDKVEIGREDYIKSLERINIVGTEDYIEITKAVKWDVPEEEGTTTSFSIVVPYTIVVDGTEYLGTYTLSSSANSSATDNNPKYNFSVTNLTKNGEIKILINKK